MLKTTKKCTKELEISVQYILSSSLAYKHKNNNPAPFSLVKNQIRSLHIHTWHTKPYTRVGLYYIENQPRQNSRNKRNQNDKTTFHSRPANRLGRKFQAPKKKIEVGEEWLLAKAWAVIYVWEQYIYNTHTQSWAHGVRRLLFATCRDTWIVHSAIGVCARL